ncbi:predicted protein [Uncinocarpus reesii 1704]|uniref:Protein kinase domain-containing protein n=1 Tax=Uncinocarpus reesii (strain UAMH 1704) TaxID=336963 RepID=C4JFB4_UNCRE|nr:uncharacterized protein UREG_02336 [Uncinocarpus reesii 1704]EEP77487.1 predicted protein [Uncinocarpus reesii 1704]
MGQTSLPPQPPAPYYPLKDDPNDPGPGWWFKGLSGEECERVTLYQHALLCPIIIGDILSGPDLLSKDSKQCSFKIIGKLGYGSYSTVWLGQDLYGERCLVIKVLRFEVSTLDNSEMRILRKLGKLRVAFFQQHNDRKYLCLGLDPLGPSLRIRMETDIQLPSNLATILQSMEILAKKVSALHQQRICHGDISHCNVAFDLHNDAFTDEALKISFQDDTRFRFVFTGSAEEPALPPGLPKYIISNGYTALLGDGTDLSKIELLDFGKAFEGFSKDNALGTEPYLALEMHGETGGHASDKSDIWSLGCVLCYALTDFYFLERKEFQIKYSGIALSLSLNF